MLMPKRFFLLTMLLCLYGISFSAFPDEQKNRSRLVIVGSDTMAQLISAWQSEIKKDLDIEWQATGSSTAIPALIEGSTDIGAMSRALTDKERDSFIQKFGYAPTEIRVAQDLMVFYVHRDNPLSVLSKSQIDSIFSQTLFCSTHTRPILAWKDLGVKGEVAKHPIVLYGRAPMSGTYAWVRSSLLCGGDFRLSVNQMLGSAAVVRAIGNSKNALGYSSLAYYNQYVKILAVKNEKGEAVYPSVEQAKGYPLQRYLYLYLNKEPHKVLSGSIRRFLTYLFSADGQKKVLESGYVPLSQTELKKQSCYIMQGIQ